MKETYSLISELYDIMYAPKNGFDYKKDILWVDKWRKKYNLPKEVLDTACGTGRHIKQFKKSGYNVSGIDISRGMVKIAKKRNNNVEIKQGNFSKFSNKKRHSMITAFFNSMGYHDNEKEMLFTFKNIYKNLKDDGLFIFDIFTKTKQEKIFMVRNYKLGDISFSRTFLGFPSNKKFKSIVYYIVNKGKKIEHIKIDTSQGIFTKEIVLKLLKKSGFKQLYSGKGYSDKSTTTFVCRINRFSLKKENASSRTQTWVPRRLRMIASYSKKKT